MKKFLIASISVLFLAIAAFIGVATVYFKPFIKEQILAQLAHFGYEEATIGDISVGLYKSSISEIDLKKSGQNTIGEIAVTYWPQQLLQKQIDTIQIKNGTVQVEIKSNGDVIAAGYRIPQALAPKTNDNVQKAAAPAPASGQASSAMPFSEIIIKNFQFNITTPSNETLSGVADVTYNMNKESAEGKLILNEVKATALQEIARIASPETANMVSNLSGIVSADVNFNIPKISDMSRIPGKGTIVAKNLNFTKDDMRIQNLNTNMRLENFMPLTIADGQKVSIDTVTKSKINIRNVAATFGLKDNRYLNVGGANLDIAGGTIVADAFKADIENINTLINLTVKHVKLADFAQAFNVPAFNINGELNGRIPVKLQNGRVIIDQAVVNTVLQNFGADKLREKVDQKLDKTIGREMERLNQKLGIPAPVQQQPAPQPAPVAPNSGIQNQIQEEGSATPQTQEQPATQQQPAQQQPTVEDALKGIIRGLGR